MLVAAYPRSGSTWLCHLLSECLDAPEYRDLKENDMPEPRLERPEGVTWIKRTHVDDPNGAPEDMDRKTLYLLRDGRDVVVSYYFYQNFFVSKRRSIPSRVRWDLMRRMQGGQHKQLTNAIREFAPQWKRHVDNWIGENPTLPVIRYRELNHNTEQTLAEVFDQFDLSVPEQRIAEVVERNRFEVKTGRQPGKEVPEKFKRKGIVGVTVHSPCLGALAQTFETMFNTSHGYTTRLHPA